MGRFSRVAAKANRPELPEHRTTPGRARDATSLGLVGLVGAVMALAWLALWVLGHSPYGRFLNHEEIAGGALASGVFLAGWGLMIVAMMLPSAIPLLRAFSRTAGGRPDHLRLLLAVTLGYLLAWMGFGLAVRIGDLLVHGGVSKLSWLESRPRLVAAAVLTLAGLHQLSPMRNRCLTKCRTPMGFMYRYWTGKHALSDALRVGALYGVSCIGCCLGIMLVMFSLGLGSLGWMLLLGSVMVLEKETKWGGSLSTPVAILLFATGAAVALQDWG